MRRVASAFSVAFSIGAFTAMPATAGYYYNTSGPGPGYPPPVQYVAPPSQGTTTYYEQGPAYTTTRVYAPAPVYAPPPPAYYQQQPAAAVNVYNGAPVQTYAAPVHTYSAPIQTYSGPPVVQAGYEYAPRYSHRSYDDRPYYRSDYGYRDYGYRSYGSYYYPKPYRPRTVYSGGAFLQTGDVPNCGQRTYVPYGWTWIRGRDYRC
jgi:hypothetical protein